ncbi:MAG: hypothetical protein QM770_08010 [Tepidisphaeraceae bacterium]
MLLTVALTGCGDGTNAPATAQGKIEPKLGQPVSWALDSRTAVTFRVTSLGSGGRDTVKHANLLHDGKSVSSAAFGEAHAGYNEIELWWDKKTGRCWIVDVTGGSRSVGCTIDLLAAKVIPIDGHGVSVNLPERADVAVMPLSHD